LGTDSFSCLLPSRHDRRLPLYVQPPRAYVRKGGERLLIEVEREQVAEARLGETSQVVLFGYAGYREPMASHHMVLTGYWRIVASGVRRVKPCSMA